MFIYILEWWEDEIFVDAVLSDEVWHGGQAVDVNGSVEAGESFRVQTQMWELFGTQCRWLSPTTQLLLQTDYRMWTIATEWRLLVSNYCQKGEWEVSSHWLHIFVYILQIYLFIPPLQGISFYSSKYASLWSFVACDEVFSVANLKASFVEEFKSERSLRFE